MASNHAFRFHMALNFRLCILKMLQLLGDSSPNPLPGLRPWIPLGDFRPPDSLICCPQLDLLDPPCTEMNEN